MKVLTPKTDAKLVYYGPHPCQKCDSKKKNHTLIVKAGNGAPDYLEFDYPNKEVDLSKRENWLYPNEKPYLKWKRHVCVLKTVGRYNKKNG